MVLFFIFAFLRPATWWHDENVDCPHLYHVIMGSYTLIVGALKYFLIFGGFVRLDSDPLGLSSYGAFVQFSFSLCGNVMAWRECWLSTPVSCDHGIVHLDCWSHKIFSHFWGFCPPWWWSFGAFVLWCFCPFLLFSVRPRDGMTRMLIVHTCIMWSWDRTPWLLESSNIFSFWGVLSALILILWGFRPMVFLSNFAFLCAATWWHDENVDCPHLYHVIMGSYTLIVGVLKYFLIFEGFVRLDSDPLGVSSCGAFVHFCFSLCGHVMAWRECWLSTPVSCDHGIVHLYIWSLKIFSHFLGGLSALMLILWGFRLVVLLSIFAFFCAAKWWHDENVDCPHLYHVIMGSYTLIVGALKYFLIFGAFVRLDSDPLGLSSYSAFVHFCFSLCGHVMAWRECWLSTPVSCDHVIVHLDCWSIKIFSHFWGFCPLWFWSSGAFVL